MYACENIEMSLNYIEQHLSEKIETEKLAEIACLSTFYYQRLFKIIYVFLTIFLYLLKCPQSLIL